MEAKAIHLPKKKTKVVSVIGTVLPGKKVTNNEYVITDRNKKGEMRFGIRINGYGDIIIEIYNNTCSIKLAAMPSYFFL